MKILTPMCILLIFLFDTKTGTQKPSGVSVDYCKKLDTLVKDVYYWKPKYSIRFERILKEVIHESKIDGTYQMGYFGMQYCDTFFNNDMRKWCKYFNCNIRLPAANKKISAWCDTTKFIIEE